MVMGQGLDSCCEGAVRVSWSGCQGTARLEGCLAF